MPIVDLFGNVTPDKTKEEEYKEYIASAKWKKKRTEALRRAGYRCEKCKIHNSVRRLDVHHLNYEHFKNERPEDLIVVCAECHFKADRERERKVAIENSSKLEHARFNGWATKVYGDDWMMYENEESVYEEFREWVERNEF